MSTETFAKTMNGASIEAQKYATNIKNGTGSSQTFATNQKVIQSSMNETSIVSQIAAAGLNLFKATLNSLIFFAVIEGIQLLIKGLDSLILTAEEAEEKAESLRNNMQSFFDEVQSGQKTISSISDRFSELNEHVTETGENIDLTNDEYSEYLDICNQVKSIMPELISGYTNEGNAIITLKDNVDSLTESYKENIRIKAAAFVSNGDDDGNTIESFFDDYKIFTEGEGGLFAPSAGGAWNNKSTDYEDYYGYDKVHEWLSDVADLTLEDLQNLQKGTTQATYLYALLKENGYELANITEDNYEAVHDVLNTRLTSLESEMTTRVSNIKMSLQQMLYADADYWDIDNQKALSAINSLFSDVDAEFIKQNNLLGKTALQSFESNVIKLFKNDDTQQAMVDIYTPQGQDESIVDYSKRVNDAIQEIQDYVTDKQIDIPLNFNNVTNNVETLQKQYDSAIEQTKKQFEGDTSAATEALKTAQENLQDEYAKIEKWGLGDYADQIKNGTIQSVFGNVDMDKRTIITWSDELKQTYQDELASWDYDPEIGTIDTVYGMSGRFGESLSDNGWEVAFTPILPDGTFLSADTVYDYIEAILQQAYVDDGQVTDEELKAIDAQGMQIGDTFVKGIYAGIDEGLNYENNGNWAETVGRLMHFSGDYGAVNLAEQAIEEAKKMQEDFDWDSWFKENSINTKEEIANWLEIAQAANSAAEARKRYIEGETPEVEKVSFDSLFDKGENDEDSAFQQTIDKYIEQVDKLKTALEKYKSQKKSNELSGDNSKDNSEEFTSEDLVELIEEFPQLASETDNLEEAILSLLSELDNDIVEVFSEQFGKMDTADDINALSNLQNALMSFRHDMVDTLDFSDMVDGIGNVLDGLDGLVEAIDKLKEGTALTKYELADLVLEYPKLLTVSNLFTDGSIKGQQAMLDNLLQIYEAEYNATLDTKIAELRASNIVLDSAIENERAKAAIVTEIASEEVMATAEYKAWLIEKLQEFNALDSQNYVEYSNGILTINEEKLNEILNEEVENQKDATENVWQPQAVTIAESYAEGLSSGMQSLNTAGKKTKVWITSAKEYFKSFAKTVAASFEGVVYDDGVNSDITVGSTGIQANVGTIDFSGISKDLNSRWKDSKIAISDFYSSVNDQINQAIKELEEENNTISIEGLVFDGDTITINGEDLQEWTDSQQKIINERIEQLKEQVSTNNIAIKNLEELKGLDLEELYKTVNPSSSNKDKSTSEETFDWIEIKLKRIQRAIDNLSQTASAAYKSWSTRNSALASQMSKVTSEISLQQQAYTRYMKEANSVGLSSTYKTLVQQGAINISTITDEDLADKIQAYQKWYEAALDAQDAIQDLQDTLAELARQEFDNLVQQYEDKLSSIEHESNIINSLIEKAETSGHLVSSQYYEQLIAQEQKNKALLEKEYSSLKSQLADSMSSGNIVKESEEWYAMQQSIHEVQEAIVETDVALADFSNSLRDLKWDVFDRLQDKITNITTETEFLLDLMQDSELYDDNGQLTNTGMATMGLHGQNYNVYMAQADKYAKEIASLDKEYADDVYNTDYLERRQELLELQQDSILAANDEKQAIADLVEEGINIELDALNELIQKYKDAMSEAKDLFDYQKQIKEATDNISSLQKQLSAYSNDTAEETKAKIQQLKVELESAQEDLEETEMEHALDEASKLLDELYNDYEMLINTRLDNIELLVSDMIENINANSVSISETLMAEASNVGYTISDSIQSIWNNDGLASVIITKYGDNFCSQLTSVNTVLNTISEQIAAMTKESDKDATTEINTSGGTTASTNKTSTTNTSSSSSTSASSSKTITVGGKINAGNAKIYDYVGDKSGETQYYKKDPIYTVLAEKNGYLKVRHHKLSKGTTGWFKKADVKAYKTGGLAEETGLAWLDGTKSKPEIVLNSEDTKNFMELTDTLRQLTQEEIRSLVPSTTSSMFDFSAPNVPNGILNNTTQNMDNTFNMTFEINGVNNGEEFINYLIKSDRFEKAIEAMTINKLTGGSKLAKNKYFK